MPPRTPPISEGTLNLQASTLDLISDSLVLKVGNAFNIDIPTCFGHCKCFSVTRLPRYRTLKVADYSDAERPG